MSLAAKRAKKKGLNLNLKIDPGETNKVGISDIDNYNKITGAVKGMKGDDEDHGAEHYFSSVFDGENKENVNPNPNGGRKSRKSRRKLRRKTNRKSRRKSQRKSRRKSHRRTSMQKYRKRTRKKGGGQKERNIRALQNALTTINDKCNISLVHMGPISYTDAGMYNSDDFSLTTKGARIIEHAKGLSSNRHGCETVIETLTKDPFNFR